MKYEYCNEVIICICRYPPSHPRRAGRELAKPWHSVCIRLAPGSSLLTINLRSPYLHRVSQKNMFFWLKRITDIGITYLQRKGYFLLSGWWLASVTTDHSDGSRSHKIGQIASHRSGAGSLAKIPCGLPDRKLQSLWLRTLPGLARQQRQWGICGNTRE